MLLVLFAFESLALPENRKKPSSNYVGRFTPGDGPATQLCGVGGVRRAHPPLLGNSALPLG